jgi:hypothetical protein
MGDSAHTTHHTNPGKKSFLEDENIFQKSAPLVECGIAIEFQLTEPIFEKSSHLREKGGVLMLLKTTLHLLIGTNPQYIHTQVHYCTVDPSRRAKIACRVSGVFFKNIRPQQFTL